MWNTLKSSFPLADVIGNMATLRMSNFARLTNIRYVRLNPLRRFADEAASKPAAAAASPPPPPPPAAQESGQNDNTKYQATEYYAYNEWSFYDIDNDMAKYRLPQPTTADPLPTK